MDHKSLEEELSKLSKSNESNNSKTPVGEYLEQEKTFYPQYISGFLEEKRDVLKKSTSNRFVDGKNVVVELRKPFNKIAESVALYCCPQQRRTPRTCRDNIADSGKAKGCAGEVYKIVKDHVNNSDATQ